MGKGGVSGHRRPLWAFCYVHCDGHGCVRLRPLCPPPPWPRPWLCFLYICSRQTHSQSRAAEAPSPWRSPTHSHQVVPGHCVSTRLRGGSW